MKVIENRLKYVSSIIYGLEDARGVEICDFDQPFYNLIRIWFCSAFLRYSKANHLAVPTVKELFLQVENWTVDYPKRRLHFSTHHVPSQRFGPKFTGIKISNSLRFFI